MKRRDFLKAGAASAVVAGSGLPVVGATIGRRPRLVRRGRQPRNIIFLVSDGMSSGTLSMADQYTRWKEGRSSHWIRLYEEGRVQRGLMETASLNSIVTDSAAASSAWGCGRRVNNDALNIGPNGEEYEPILVTAKRYGKATGLVTTATVTHATPAGFAANLDSRWREEDIAVQYLERDVDVMLGGGVRLFDPEFRSDHRDLLSEARAAGYRYVQQAAAMRAAADDDSQKLLGLFADWHVPFELDRINNPEAKVSVPSLKDMMLSALQILNRNEDGFIMQVEGARVDHAAHGNDIAGLLFDQLAFDEAVGAAAQYAERAGDTLVIVTTDHGNANPGLNSGGKGGDRRFTVLSRFTGTQDAMLGRLHGESSVEDIQRVVHELSEIEVTPERAELLLTALRGEYQAPYHRNSDRSTLLGQIIANETDIGWAGTRHTSDHVELAALGPGSEGIRAFQKNTDLYDLMVNTWS